MQVPCEIGPWSQPGRDTGGSRSRCVCQLLVWSWSSSACYGPVPLQQLHSWSSEPFLWACGCFRMSTMKIWFCFFFCFLVEAVNLLYSSVSWRFIYCSPGAPGAVISAVHSCCSVVGSALCCSAGGCGTKGGCAVSPFCTVLKGKHE